MTVVKSIPKTPYHRALEAAQAIFKRMEDILPNIKIGNNKVLLAVYVRDKVGSLYVSPGFQKEDELQGKAALVVKVGPLVDAKEEVRGFSIAVGDWVAVNASDGWSMNMGPPNDRLMLRLLNESSIHMKISEPEIIW